MSEHKPILPAGGASPPRAIPFEPAQLRRRHDGWTAERQIAFIETLAATKCVDEACRRVGMSDTSAYELRARPCGAAFARAWDVALEFMLDRVEQGGVERSINGTPRPVFYKGEQVGEWRHYDERLTMFLLRSRRPERYARPPGEEPEQRHRYGPAIALADALTEIAIRAPQTLGNALDDWSDDEDGGEAACDGTPEDRE